MHLTQTSDQVLPHAADALRYFRYFAQNPREYSVPTGSENSIRPVETTVVNRVTMSLFPQQWFNRKAKAREGYLYVISNPSMPGLVKVGMTSKSPAERMKSLYSTSVPTPFEAEYFALCKDRLKSEAVAHQALKSWRLNSRREFFRMAPEDAIAKIHYGIDDARVIFSRHRLRKTDRGAHRWIRALAALTALATPSLCNALNVLSHL
jgi:hypothetical protein